MEVGAGAKSETESWRAVPVEPIWTRRAEADLQLLFNAFEARQERAGVALLLACESSLVLLSAFPEMAPVLPLPSAGSFSDSVKLDCST